MIQLTYRQIVTTPIAPAIRKLCQLSVFDGKTAYRLHKINEKITSEYVKSMQDFQLVGSQYAQKNEAGEFLMDDKGQHVPIEGKEQEYKEALEEFLDTTFDIPQHKIKVDALTTRFSPQEIAALEPLIEGLE